MRAANCSKPGLRISRRRSASRPQEYPATAHGLYWSKEGDSEFLYWTENVAGPKDKRIGARIYKTDMDGKILFQIGNVAKESDTAVKFDVTNPTDVAIAANGDIYVVDGYGSQKVHRFDKNFKLLKTIGGPGNDHGKFNTCHGVWVSTLKKEPEIYIADRANNRLEVYSPELEYKRTVPDMRMPCCFYQHEGQLFIPELGQRVTILDADDKIVARLGDGKGVEKEIGKHPDKFAISACDVRRFEGEFLYRRVGRRRPRAEVQAHAGVRRNFSSSTNCLVSRDAESSERSAGFRRPALRSEDSASRLV